MSCNSLMTRCKIELSHATVLMTLGKMARYEPRAQADAAQHIVVRMLVLEIEPTKELYAQSPLPGLGEKCASNLPVLSL